MIKKLLFTIALLFLPIGFILAADITATSLTAGSDDTNATVYTTASISPTANRLVLVHVFGLSTGATTTPTIAGNGMNWVEVDDGAAGASWRSWIFRSASSTPATGAITFTFASTQNRAAWNVVEFANMDTSGTDGSGAIIQSASSSKESGANVLTTTLGTFSNSANATFGGIAANATGITDVTPGTGFTTVNSSTPVEDSMSHTEFKTTNDTTVDWSWDGTSGGTASGIAVEIKNATQAIVADDAEMQVIIITEAIRETKNTFYI